ncbi:TIGR01459 family HAD-type hydrolase [Lacibacterium aquatile]|uniref:TIGR01459 family HAD-type hydrolase n=1 Tax=Lacibacterium aquatile TaxID=1168082 RepID=A0ABW5DT47_9PROT
MIRTIAGVAEIADAYDGFIIDLWGVLHDGASPYPDSRAALLALKAAGKHVVLLSNAPRPSADVQIRMREMGFADDDYNHLLTSGEDTRTHLRTRPDDFYKSLGQKYFLLGLPRDVNILHGVPGTRVMDVREADYVINTGVELGETLETALPVLEPALAKGLPMVCANPDITIVTRGKVEVCAGLLADWYEKGGGKVRYHGKPHPGVYQTCFKDLGLSDPKRVLAIGDGLKTDIKGANRAGCDSLLIAGGVHANELGAKPGHLPDLARLSQLAKEEQATPTYVASVFRW